MRTNLRTLLAILALLAMVATACASDDDGDDEAAADDTAEEAEEPAADEEAADDEAMDEEATDDEAMADEEPADDGGDAPSGSIEIDGSSTVAPLTDAISEEFASEAPDVTVNLGVSGTGGGFERFCGEGSTDISNASRPIEDDEVELCEENGIEFTEVRVGTDALTMVTNPATEFLTCLTTDELVSVWGPDGVSSWSEVNSDFPDEPIEIFAPDADSGTYDFFNETILEPNEIEEPRQDYNASADDNVIAQGVQGTPGSWGYFGFAYFTNNPDGVAAIEYDAGDGCVAPSVETAQDDSYGLTRPLFIYVNNEALTRPEVEAFVTFYLDTVNDVIEDVGYVPAPQEVIDEATATVEEQLGA
ncbi:PstS family phosphate ABC transporter substrate-binding protein [Euzebya tangerina]|uniref:PstS family phosphate ABC transporter substrate-binding protein n=1 Tax=Euzebya tangerina TaxID=591198 RepID=UPI000E3104DF|nr:PstS family phosphate ABC transporter substrate-binding protein [Euzebya tangerina]